jgi:hypothetical protein
LALGVSDAADRRLDAGVGQSLRVANRQVLPTIFREKTSVMNAT